MAFYSLLLTINPSAKASDIWKFGMELLDCILKSEIGPLTGKFLKLHD